jgi:plastocyanin
MKRLIVVIVAAGACAALAVPAFAATSTVQVGPKDRFGTTSLSISRGDTVRFRWTGKQPHNIRITSGPQRGSISAVRRSGTIPKTFTRAGTYRLICDVHASTMKMTVRVR